MNDYVCHSVPEENLVISFGVYFPKMNQSSQQWLGNSALVEEMYVLVYFLKCLICSISSEQKLEKQQSFNEKKKTGKKHRRKRSLMYAYLSSIEFNSINPFSTGEVSCYL